MEQRDLVIDDTLADIAYDLTGVGEKRERRIIPDYDEAEKVRTATHCNTL